MIWEEEQCDNISFLEIPTTQLHSELFVIYAGGKQEYHTASYYNNLSGSI